MNYLAVSARREKIGASFYRDGELVWAYYAEMLVVPKDKHVLYDIYAGHYIGKEPTKPIETPVVLTVLHPHVAAHNDTQVHQLARQRPMTAALHVVGFAKQNIQEIRTISWDDFEREWYFTKNNDIWSVLIREEPLWAEHFIWQHTRKRGQPILSRRAAVEAILLNKMSMKIDKETQE